MSEYKLIHRFAPDEKKLEFLTEMLLTQPLYLPDEYRDRPSAVQLIVNYLYGSNSLLYELGDYGGLIGFINILPHYKSGFIIKLWHKGLWGAELAREIRDFTTDIMALYDLRRLEFQTPDAKGARAAVLFGFREECRSKYAFRWNNAFFHNILMRKLSED